MMSVQGHLDWARPGKDRKAALWMNKFWSRICCEVKAGKGLQQALKDAQEDPQRVGQPAQCKQGKADGGEVWWQEGVQGLGGG